MSSEGRRKPTGTAQALIENLRAEVERLRKALDKFQENVWAVQQEAARIDFLERSDRTGGWVAAELIVALSALDAALHPDEGRS